MQPSLRGKTALVTGASSGIGKVTAARLAHAGANVIMVCRDGAKAKSAFEEISGNKGEGRVELFTADLSIRASIRDCAARFLESHDKLHILVNNAGIFSSHRQVTSDGFEQTFAVNHLAYFLLTNLLLDKLKASAPARIVCVASTASQMGKIDFEDIQGERGYSGMKAYAQSKLANILFTYELARRLAGTGVTANCVHPGVVRTGWAQSSTGLFGFAVRLAHPFMLSPERGAETSLYAATSPDIEGVTGKYFVKSRPAASPPLSYDSTLAARLWEQSEKWVGIS